MAPLSLKIILEDGAVTRTVMFDSGTKVADAYNTIKEKVLNADDGKEYALFLTSADNDRSGIWLEPQRPLDYYMLRNGDSLLYLHKQRNLRVKMLDGTVKTLQVDESKNIGDLMMVICGKIGITNHDEYGLCQEDMDVEESKDKENRPTTGTLTLKRKKQERERDAKMDQLSKKLKTDDNVDWLNSHSTLREEGVDPTETLLLKRRLFYSDRNVDSRDPVQLNLLYVQTRDAILNGRHPVTEAQAMEFAAIQCQIHFGDFQEEKHKPGLIENLREYLPEQYSSSWGAEKKILKLYRKHQGLSHLEAKHLYTKTARDLPTYGVTFFVVKEKQKGKKKMVPRLLGINSESILRLDEVTKEILQVWPLTHVMTYHAGKNDSFTLNFGDYSEKEYSVKTNDAHRIREILEGYIDIIRKRLCGPGGGHFDEGGAVAQECVMSGRGQEMTHVMHGSSKVVEHSFIGPTKILPFEQGSQATTGTQVMTVQQVIFTNKGSTKQEVMSGEVPMRSDMSQELVKKLNRMNANAVKVVTLLTEPTGENIQQARSIYTIMEETLPIIETGVREAAAKQTSEEAKKKLLGQLEELNGLVAGSCQKVKSNDMNPEEVQEQARQIADLTTQMYFSLDPRTKRRSEFCRRSRQSFIEDEKTTKTLRRASFIHAAAGATQALETADEILAQEYQGQPLRGLTLQQLEASAVDKLGKLNAAVALHLIAHSDPKNIDYEAAVNSMNTLKELLPELATDAKAISQAKGGDEGKEILDEMRALMDAVRAGGLLTGCEDHQKIQEAAHNFADVSGRLVYILGAGNPRVNADKENEIMELARLVGDSCTQLLVNANDLTEQCAQDPASQVLDTAGVECADATRDLLATAQLTSPMIQEPHCRSALTASCENLSAAAQRLTLAWKPLVENPSRPKEADLLANGTMELAKALDRLKNSYANLPNLDEQQELSPDQAKKLRFIATINTSRAALQDAQQELDKPMKPAIVGDNEMNELQDRISQKLAQNNAAVASLLQAKSDHQNPDYETADMAVGTISEVTPEIVKDARAVLSSCPDERARRAMLADFRAYCQGANDVCASAETDDPKDLEEATKRFAKSSKKLSFAFSPHARKAREQLMMELFNSAHKEAMQMVDDTNKMADTIGGTNADKLRDLSRDVRDSARNLQTTLMVTSPSLDSDRCRSALLTSSTHLSQAAQRLTSEAQEMQDAETGCRVLSAQLQQQQAHIAQHADVLQRALAAIRETLEDTTAHTEIAETPKQKVHRLKFIASASAAQQRAKEVEQLIEQPTEHAKLSEEQVKQLESKRARELAAVNAAIALLINAKNDRNSPNYSAAEEAIETVSELMPGIINDTKALSSTCEDKELARMLADIRAWCDAIQAVCASAGDNDLTEFVDSAQHFADTSDKLKFMFNPHKITPQEQQVLQLSQAACNTAKEMVSDCHATATSLPAALAADVCVRAKALDDAANALKTTAQLTAPCLQEPNSRATLLTSSECVRDTSEDLVNHAREHTDLRCKDLGTQLNKKKEVLDKALDGIKGTCNIKEDVENPMKKAQRLKFVAGISQVNNKLDAADNLLDQPTLGVKLTDQQAKDVQEKLSQDIARVHSAIASLLQAKSDVQNPDYIVAEKSMASISELVPAVAKETKALSTACKDEQQRTAMIQDMHAWCHAVRGVIASAGDDDHQKLDEAVQKLGTATGKMKFIVSCRRNPMKESEIVKAANEVSSHALQMAAEAERIAQTIPGVESDEIKTRAQTLKQAALALDTTAKLTAPSIHEPTSQASLLSSLEGVRTASKELVSYALRTEDPALQLLGTELQVLDGQLDGKTREFSDVCTNKKLSPETVKKQKLKFVASANAAENKAKEVEKLLDQRPSDVQLSEQGNKNLQEKLSKAMAQVNAALANIVNAKSDQRQPNYVEAEKSFATISELLPEIVCDTKDLSANSKDAETARVMMEDIRSWCAAVRAVCASAASEQHKEFNDATAQFCKASLKLRFVNSARKNPVKEQQIMQLSSSACDKAKQMADETRRTASVVNGTEADLLINHADSLSEAAVALHTTAQLTAPTIHEPQCQAALLSSADALSSSAQVLVRDTARAQHPAARRLSEEVDRYRDIMDRALNSLKTAVVAEDRRTGARGPPPPLPVKRSSLTRTSGDKQSSGTSGASVPLSPRVRLVSHSDTRRASQDWLNHERQEATEDIEASLATGGLTKPDIAELNKKANEEKLRKETFDTTADIAEECIHKAEQNLNEVSKQANVLDLDEEQEQAVRQQLELKLATANNAAAALVSSTHPDAVCYDSATKATKTLSELIPDIVKDGVLLSNCGKEKPKRALLDRIRALCEACRRLVKSRNNNQEVNEAAVQFGDSSAGLLYVIAAEVDPAQEKGVIDRARAIGDISSMLAEGAAGVAARAGASLTLRICDAGRSAADAARTLVYTAKLVAPTVHHQQSQNALITASHELSTQMKNFSSSWKPLASDPKFSKPIAEMTEEANTLEKLLEEFRKDLAGGKLIKKRQVEKIVIEDTALRRLAVQIMELAQMQAATENSPENKRKFLEYAGSLKRAIHALDVANSRCKRQPQDLSKHQDLEDAVLQLQMEVLQSRPCVENQRQNDVVDLIDFVKDTSSKAEKLMEVAIKTKAGKENKETLDRIKSECHKINLDAFRILNPDSRQDGDETSLDGYLCIDQFGQDCDNRVQNMKSLIKALKETEDKNALNKNSVGLDESSHYLRFATKCALASAQSASLNETLNDLIDLEKRVDKMLVPAEPSPPAGKVSDDAGLWKAQARVTRAASSVAREATLLPAAISSYISEIRARTDLHDTHQRNKAKEHISKVLELLKQLTAVASTRVATWQPVQCPHVTDITEQLVNELESPLATAATEGGEKQQAHALKNVELNKLLMPTDVKIEGEPKQIEEKLQQSASKLVMLMDTLTLGATQSEAHMARTAPAITATAVQLAASARSLPAQSLAHAKRTEEAAQEMCWATYNLLKAAELVSRDTTRVGPRSRLRSASNALSDAINKLARVSCTGNKLNIECAEQTRSLQTALARIQPAPCSAQIQDCIQGLSGQREVLQKLNSDEPLSRAEFSKSLNYITAAVGNSAQFAAQSAYLIQLSEHNKDLIKEGLINLPRLQKLTSAMQESCYFIMRANQVDLAKEEETKLSRLNQELQQAVKEASAKTKDAVTKRELTERSFKIDHASKALSNTVVEDNACLDKITTHTLTLVDCVGSLNSTLDRPSLLPAVGEISTETKAMSDDIVQHSKTLINKTQALIKEVKNTDEDVDPMTWVTYNTHRKSVIDAFEALLNRVRQNGQRSGLVEVVKEAEEEPDAPKKSFIQIQQETARKWLQRRPSDSRVRDAGETAANAIIDVAQHMAEDMKGPEKEELVNVITESRALVAECCKKYDNDKASLLMEHLNELRKAIHRGAVTCLVEDCLQEEPMQDLEIFLDAEKDEAKRKFLLEKKIAELMSQLGRTTRTARLVARAGQPNAELDKCREQAELLAPKLVAAAQTRVSRPDDARAVTEYRALLAEYAAALARVREMCDHSVDPLDFVQTAGETMARMREESSQHGDPMKCAYTSNAITRLASRVISVSMSSTVARADPELRAALTEAQDKLTATVPAPGTRESRLPDWKDTTAEILRTTGEVESALGGENIFKKLPVPDQPIYNAALSLHSAVRGWSARDNEIVAVAKRMAVLMARLSEQMNTDRKRELIVTSKAIVKESTEVAALAKKLANECADVRIKMNLLQVCERIPTISGQLKMLTVVKGSTLGNQGGEEDREAMNMLVTNAQNLMSSVQEVIKAAASASVKIASQRGLKWVRKNY